MKSIYVDVRTYNSSNSLAHWRVVSGQRRRVRTAVELALRQHEPLPPLPVRVTMTRISPGTMDLHDGVPNALKSVVDQIAEHYGEKDNDPRFEWKYSQVKKSKTYGVEITIEPA